MKCVYNILAFLFFRHFPFPPSSNLVCNTLAVSFLEFRDPGSGAWIQLKEQPSIFRKGVLITSELRYYTEQDFPAEAILCFPNMQSYHHYHALYNFIFFSKVESVNFSMLLHWEYIFLEPGLTPIRPPNHPVLWSIWISHLQYFGQQFKVVIHFQHISSFLSCLQI